MKKILFAAFLLCLSISAFAQQTIECSFTQARTIQASGKVIHSEGVVSFKAPDQLIYIRSSIPNLISQIQKRGRDYEKSIRIDYITGLNERYENWIKDYDGKLLVIDADTIKFGNKEEDFAKVTEMIDNELFGLFPQE